MQFEYSQGAYHNLYLYVTWNLLLHLRHRQIELLTRMIYLGNNLTFSITVTQNCVTVIEKVSYNILRS